MHSVEKPIEKRKLSFKEKQEYEQLPNEIERLEDKKEKVEKLALTF